MATFGAKAFAAINRALIFLRVVDSHDGNISITNAMAVTVLIKLACTRNASLGDLGMFFCAVGNYTAKKFANKDVTPASVIPSTP